MQPLVLRVKYLPTAINAMLRIKCAWKLPNRTPIENWKSPISINPDIQIHRPAALLGDMAEKAQ
jgi:hypothetical protein